MKKRKEHLVSELKQNVKGWSYFLSSIMYKQ